MTTKKPPRNLPKWDEKWPEELIKHMSRGLSFESFGAVVNCHRQLLYYWIDRHPKFAEAKGIGDLKSRMFWEELGRQGCAGKIKNFAPAVWIFTMKCRFGYRDGSETSHQAETKDDRVYKTKWGNKK